MNQQRKPNAKRGEMAFIFAIVLGLALGIAIKRIRIGLLVGVVLGLFIVITGFLRSTKR